MRRPFSALLLAVPCLLALTFAEGCRWHKKYPHTGPDPGSPPGSGAVLAEGALNPDARQGWLARPAAGTGIRVEPPGGPAFRFIVDESRPLGRGTVYQGHVEGAAGSSGTVAVLGQAISGTIRIPGRPVYTLATDRSGRPGARASAPQSSVTAR